jgi:DNA-binding PadR family transcriptional regulator
MIQSMATLLSQSKESPPLSPAVFAVLLALADGEKHGYAIMQEARAHTPMGPGTLYGTLDRMLESGLVRETGLSEDGRRRYYELTAAGKRSLAVEMARMQHAVKLARAKGVRALEAKP